MYNENTTRLQLRACYLYASLIKMISTIFEFSQRILVSAQAITC